MTLEDVIDQYSRAVAIAIRAGNDQATYVYARLAARTIRLARDRSAAVVLNQLRATL